MLLRHIKLGLVALTALVGATSWLDKYPDSAIPEKDAMQTFADAEQHLIGIYGHLMNSALYSGYLTLLPDIQCDLAYAPTAISGSGRSVPRTCSFRTFTPSSTP
mgnify:CR=1 FL=1